MENYPYSYPDSHDSSPRSLNNESWDDQQPAASQKVKFMISYNGKILPRPHDNQLTYVGGETKILALDRTIRFSAIVSKLSSFTSDEITFKYQLPGEDLDALISVTNDEDLEHMMAEYDRLHRSSGGGGSKPARLRLFLFPVSNSNQSSFSGDDPKPNQQWFVDALNAVPVSVPPIDASSPPASASNPSDLLFGFDKQPVSTPAVPVSVPVSAKQDVEGKVAVGSDSGSERGGGGDPMYEMHRQIQDLQRLQIQEQKQQQQQLQQQLQQAAMFQRSNEGNINLARANYDYYMPEKPAAASVPVTVAPAGYWQDRNTAVSGGYSDQINSIERQQQQQQVHQQQQQQAHQQQQQQQQQHQLYMISSQGYQAPVTNVRQVTGQVGHTGQGYYGVQMQQRVAQDVYREQPMYAMGPPQVQQQQQQHPQMKMMMGEVGGGGGGGGGGGSGGGYTTQVGYDSTGRQVYYTTPSAQAGIAGIGATYQTAVSVDPRQAGQLNQESKVVKPPQAS